MSKFGSITSIKARRQIQFSLREVLLVAAVTFCGMALIVPANFRDAQPLGCLAVVVATGAAAFLAFSCTRMRSWWRHFLLIVSVALAWSGLYCSAEILSFLSSLSIDPALLGLAIAPVTTVTILAIAIAKLSQRRPLKHRRGWSIMAMLAVVNAVLLSAALLPSAFTRLLLPPRSGTNPSPSIFNASTGKFTAAFSNAEIGNGREAPFSGYLFKVLKAQGEHAPGERKSYVNECGDMTDGFAMVMRPATYYVTGRITYMVSHDGNLYSADLGPDTATIVEQMTEFDPNPNIWTCVEDGRIDQSSESTVSGTFIINGDGGIFQTNKGNVDEGTVFTPTAGWVPNQ